MLMCLSSNLKKLKNGNKYNISSMFLFLFLDGFIFINAQIVLLLDRRSFGICNWIHLRSLGYIFHVLY